MFTRMPRSVLVMLLFTRKFDTCCQAMRQKVMLAKFQSHASQRHLKWAEIRYCLQYVVNSNLVIINIQNFYLKIFTTSRRIWYSLLGIWRKTKNKRKQNIDIAQKKLKFNSVTVVTMRVLNSYLLF